MCDSGSCSHFETGQKGFWSLLFFFFFRSKQKTKHPKKDLDLFSNKQSIHFLCRFLVLFLCFHVQNFHESHALFIWLFSSLFTRYWKMSNLYGAWHASPISIHLFPFIYSFIEMNSFPFVRLHFCILVIFQGGNIIFRSWLAINNNLGCSPRYYQQQILR